MAIDPKFYAEQVKRARMVEADRPCPHCAFNLKGLGVEGHCPECGQKFTAESSPIVKIDTRSKPGPSAMEVRFYDVPLNVLRRLAQGTSLMWIGSLILFGGLALSWVTLTLTRMNWLQDTGVTIGSQFLFFTFPGALLWWLGSMRLCLPSTVLRVGDRDRDLYDLSPSRVSGWVRFGAIGQVLVPAAMLCAGISARRGGFSEWDETGPWIVGASVMGALGGVLAGPVGLVIRNLADLARDDDAFKRSYTLVFGTPIGAIIIAMTPLLHGELGGGQGLIGMGWSAIIFSVCFWVPWTIIMSMHTLSSACRWAPTNARLAREKEERFIAKAKQAAFEADKERFLRGEL